MSKFFFLHIFATLTLFISAISFIVAGFQIVNLTVPDPLLSGSYRADYYDENLRSSLAFLIVALPVYIGTLVHLRKAYLKDASLRALRSRKWLVHFTLFVAASTVLFSLVTLVHKLLDGELTLSFALKFLVILAVASTVTLYYRWDEERYAK